MSVVSTAFTKALATIRSCVASTQLEQHAIVGADERHRVSVRRFSKHKRFAVIKAGNDVLILVPIKVERADS